MNDEMTLRSFRKKAKDLLWEVAIRCDDDEKVPSPIEIALTEAWNEAIEASEHAVVHVRCEDAPETVFRKCCWALDKAWEDVRKLRK